MIDLNVVYCISAREGDDCGEVLCLSFLLLSGRPAALFCFSFLHYHRLRQSSITNLNVEVIVLTGMYDFYSQFRSLKRFVSSDALILDVTDRCFSPTSVLFSYGGMT